MKLSYEAKKRPHDTLLTYQGDCEVKLFFKVGMSQTQRSLSANADLKNLPCNLLKRKSDPNIIISVHVIHNYTDLRDLL